MRPPARLFAALALAALPACGSPGAPVSPAPQADGNPGAAPGAGSPPVKPASRLGDLAGVKVFDEQGNASTCGPPKADCPPLPASNDFLDRCRLAGFVVRQCGCEARCAGDVAALSRHYNADGHLAECTPARSDCTPPQASTSFQDACSERGFRLDVCGCDWLCSGDFKR